ncbi:thioredoxin domain-containing protein [Streptomyces sp. NPDC048297]|uniref:thioredoxin domain-containing protein n=1 Tax=Streptomyces sp. NPDC048297 TaxID=3365531 RepID=UPI00371F692E
MRGIRGGIAVLATAVMLAVSLTGCGEQGPKKDEKPGKASYKSLGALPERLGNDGTTVVVGDMAAPVAVRLYEDPRCPVCKVFETKGAGPVLREATLQRQTRTEYTLGSFLDDRLGGSGSKRAVNALRAALDAGRFAEYHDVLYTHQPEESVDGYTTARLLELAGQVEGLRSPAFDAAVKGMKYRDFVTASQDAMDRERVPGTPTADVNGVRLRERMGDALFDGAAFSLLLATIQDDPEAWRTGADM